MYSAATVANAFLRIASQEGKKLTNMKLQKLVYIAHGWSWALRNRPLLREPVYAWQWGPVIKPLYEELKQYGAGVVTRRIPRPVYEPEEILDDESMGLIRSVWNQYKHFSAVQLSTITHQKGTPWSETWTNIGQYSEIPPDLIKRHYRQLRNAQLESRATF